MEKKVSNTTNMYYPNTILRLALVVLYPPTPHRHLVVLHVSVMAEVSLHSLVRSTCR